MLSNKEANSDPQHMCGHLVLQHRTHDNFEVITPSSTLFQYYVISSFGYWTLMWFSIAFLHSLLHLQNYASSSCIIDYEGNKVAD
jgi:hypothetical protein